MDLIRTIRPEDLADMRRCANEVAVMRQQGLITPSDQHALLGLLYQQYVSDQCREQVRLQVLQARLSELPQSLDSGASNLTDMNRSQT
jgi:hypothetical protein